MTQGEIRERLILLSFEEDFKAMADFLRSQNLNDTIYFSLWLGMWLEDEDAYRLMSALVP